jgi:hypothetical protein
MAAYNVTGALVAIALFLGAGLGLTLCLPGFTKTGLAGRLAFAYLLGVAWIGLFLYIASHFGRVPIDGPLVFLAAFLPLAAGAAVAVRLLATRRWREPAARSRRRLQTLGWIGLSLLAIVISAAVLANALTHPLEDWDGRMTWSAQAIFIREEGTVDAGILRSPVGFVSHPRYPLLMPLVQTAALEAAGSDDERVFRAVYAMFFPALVLLVINASRRWAGARAALLTGIVLLTIPWIPFFREGGAIGAYSDLPLACFAGGGLLLLLRGRPRASTGVAVGLLLAAALLTKNEGLPEAGIAIALAGFSAIAAALRRHSKPARARLLATTVAFSLLLAAFVLLSDWRSSIPNRYDESYFEKFSVSSFVRNLASPRAFSTLPVIASRMLSTEAWGLFWWLTPVIFLAAAPNPRRPPTALLAVAAATPVVVAWSAYAQVQEAGYYAGVTWNRILLHAAVPGCVLLALAVRRLLHLTRPSRSETRASRRPGSGSDPGPCH